ncbi:MAG: hypothetical protein AAGD07_20475 [Planctomycetota bacterium]
METHVATWQLWATQDGAPRSLISVAIYLPEIDPKSKQGDYRTLVEIDAIGLRQYSYGANSLQSLVLAMQLLQVRVDHAVRTGRTFYFDEQDTEPFDLLHSLSTRPGMLE